MTTPLTHALTPLTASEQDALTPLRSDGMIFACVKWPSCGGERELTEAQRKLVVAAEGGG